MRHVTMPALETADRRAGRVLADPALEVPLLDLPVITDLDRVEEFEGATP